MLPGVPKWDGNPVQVACLYTSKSGKRLIRQDLGRPRLCMHLSSGAVHKGIWAVSQAFTRFRCR